MSSPKSVEVLQPRHRGKFIKKRKLEWLKNISMAAKRPRNREPPESTLTVNGRRLINLKILADGLWCTFCDIPLCLKYIVGETFFGLASKLTVRCYKCLALKEVPTDSTHRTSDGKLCFSVNSKAAIGMIDAGMGHTHVNTFLSAMNVPALSQTLMKRHERVVGPALEKMAKESCVKSLELEKQLTISASSPQSPSALAEETQVMRSTGMGSSSISEQLITKPISLAASYDAGWQQKGSGRSYNSKTAQGTLIGVRSRKIIGYATRKKWCSKCKHGNKHVDHDCRANFSRSSKAMEPDMVVELIARNKTLEHQNVIIGTLIGDGDASSIAAVRRESTHQIVKWEDLNHAKKTVTSNLYAMKVLSTPTIKYLTRCFGAALKQNKGDVEMTRKALLSIPKHVFDDHTDCGKWCRYNTAPNTYTHRDLPGGKGLSGDALKAKITDLFTRMANNAEGLAPCGSSQANESMHNVVCSTSAKNRYYGGTESFDYRVASAVSQKNSGTQYVVAVNEDIGASPGDYTKKFRETKDIIRKRQSEIRQSRAYKTRRKILATDENKLKETAARKEGISYETACFNNGMGQLIDEPREQINGSHIIVFDLETSGFGKNAEICQIAAKFGEQEFNVYTAPEKGIPAKVTEVTRLHTVGGELFLHNSRVTTTPLRLAMLSFFEFLRKIGKGLVLLAHNCFTFDAPKLLQHITQLKLVDEFAEIVSGFADSLPLFREKLADTKRPRNQFKQVDLARDFLGIGSDDAHNALVDVDVLASLIKKIDISDETILRQAKSVRSLSQAGTRKLQIAGIVKALDFLRPEVSAGMVKKMALNGITLELLRKVYTENGEKGLELLFGEDLNGKPRITKQKKVLANTVKKLRVSCFNVC